MRIVDVVIQLRPYVADTASQRAFGCRAVVPDFLDKGFAADQIVGRSGQAHQNFHRGRRDVVGTTRAADGASQGADIIFTQPETLSEMLGHLGAAHKSQRFPDITPTWVKSVP